MTKTPDGNARFITSQNELVGSITHDLKGMLSGIEGGLYFIDSGIKKDKRERLDEGLAMLKRNLSRIRETVGSVLYYVKDRVIDWQPLDAQAIASRVVKGLEAHADGLGVELKVTRAEGTFAGDDFAVYSAILNLTQYALDACKLAKASPSPSVTLSASPTGTQVVFEIRAYGFVMGDEAVEDALTQYYSPRGADRSHLVLFMAHRLIKRHGGTLRISIDPDQGITCFEAGLPINAPSGRAEGPDDPVDENLLKEWESRE